MSDKDLRDRDAIRKLVGATATEDLVAAVEKRIQGLLEANTRFQLDARQAREAWARMQKQLAAYVKLVDNDKRLKHPQL